MTDASDCPKRFRRLSFAPGKRSGRPTGNLQALAEGRDEREAAGCAGEAVLRARSIRWWQRLIRAGVRPNTITTSAPVWSSCPRVAYGLGHIRLGGAAAAAERGGRHPRRPGGARRGDGHPVRRLLRLDARPGGRRRHLHRHRRLPADRARRRLPGPGRHRLHGGHPQLAPGLLRPGAGRRAGPRLQGRDRPAGGADPAGSGWPRCWWARARMRCVLEGIVALLAVASIITVVQRFVYVLPCNGADAAPGSRARAARARSAPRRSILSRKDVSSG